MLELARFVVGTLIVGAACYTPSPAVGLPCSPTLECPVGQSCDVGASTGPTCVITGSTAVDAPSAGDGPSDASIDASIDAPVDAPVDAPLIRPPNDLPANPIDVSAGGMFAYDLTNATSDFTPTCATSAGPDVFYTVTLAAEEVLYLDTLGSTGGDPVISIRAGDCTPIGTAEACVNDSCGGTQAQGAWSLAAGTHCIVIDQVGVGSAGMLRVVRGGRGGDPLTAPSGSVSGNTCGDDDSNNAVCGCGGVERDHHYFFTTCPGTRTAMLDMCNASTNYDAVLQLRDGAYASLECNDRDVCGGSETLTKTIAGPGLFWAIVEGCDDCGAYMMTYSF